MDKFINKVIKVEHACIFNLLNNKNKVTVTTIKPTQPYFKGKGEHSVNELEKMCQQYKDYISYINSQPKEEVDVWEAKCKALLESHNELLNELIEVCSDYNTMWDADEPKSSTAKTVVRLTNLINKAKNI